MWFSINSNIKIIAKNNAIVHGDMLINYFHIP